MISTGELLTNQCNFELMPKLASIVITTRSAANFAKKGQASSRRTTATNPDFSYGTLLIASAFLTLLPAVHFHGDKSKTFL